MSCLTSHGLFVGSPNSSPEVSPEVSPEASPEANPEVTPEDPDYPCPRDDEFYATAKLISGFGLGYR